MDLFVFDPEKQEYRCVLICSKAVDDVLVRGDALFLTEGASVHEFHIVVTGRTLCNYDTSNPLLVDKMSNNF